MIVEQQTEAMVFWNIFTLVSATYDMMLYTAEWKVKGQPHTFSAVLFTLGIKRTDLHNTVDA
jgi:hypothetical protein